MSIRVSGVTKSFGIPETSVLKGIDFSVDESEMFAITGRSGSGKSTLLYIVSSLDAPTAGTVEIDHLNVHQLDSAKLHEFRNRQMGFVFQFHYLLPELSAVENVLMPALKSGLVEDRRPYALELLKEFGLSHRLHHRPAQLSGGEQQRVAIARALVMEPRYLFADEPTGNLDSVNGEVVMGIFRRFNREKKMTVMYVTHEESYAKMAHRRIHLVDGRIFSK